MGPQIVLEDLFERYSIGKVQLKPWPLVCSPHKTDLQGLKLPVRSTQEDQVSLSQITYEWTMELLAMEGSQKGPRTIAAQRTSKAQEGRAEGKQGYGISFLRWSSFFNIVIGILATGPLPSEVIDLLQKIATRDSGLAEEVSALLPAETSEKDQLKMQQKKLNMLRKIQSRISKKEKAIKDKEASMGRFLQEIKKHVESEKIRHKQETELLGKELQELRDQLAKVKDDKMEIVEDETTADLEDILEENDQEKIKLKAQLDAAEQANKAMKSQLAQIQGQMTEFMIHYNTKAMDTVVPVGTPPGLAFTPEQSVKKPANLLETGLAPGTNTGLHRDAKQPFGVARRERPPHGPYTPSPHQEGEEIKNQLHKLEGMDL